MAKRRSWHFYLSIITISLILGFHLLWIYTPLKDEVRAIIIQKLKPYLGESFLFNDFSIGVSSISFYKIRTASSNSSFALDLEEIEIGFKIFKLVTNRFRLPEAIKSVTFVNPRFVLQRSDTGPTPDPQISPDRIIEEIVVNMQKFPEIDHITITNGEINWQYRNIDEAALSNDLREQIVFESGRMLWRSPGKSQVPLLEGLAGTFTRDVAETKVMLVMDTIHRNQYPLQCFMRKDPTYVVKKS